MNQMAMPMQPFPQTVTVTSQPHLYPKHQAPIIVNGTTEQQQPVTLYVGRLHKGITDKIIEQILNECGKVKTWKRAEGFGFAEFENVEGGMRCLRVINGLKVRKGP
eukprot:UN20031